MENSGNRLIRTPKSHTRLSRFSETWNVTYAPFIWSEYKLEAVERWFNVLTVTQEQTEESLACSNRLALPNSPRLRLPCFRKYTQAQEEELVWLCLFSVFFLFGFWASTSASASGPLLEPYISFRNRQQRYKYNTYCSRKRCRKLHLIDWVSSLHKVQPICRSTCYVL